MTKKCYKRMDLSLLLTHHISGCIALWNGVIDSLILQGTFSSVSKCFSCNKGKAEQSWDEWMNEWMNKKINQ